MSESSISPKSCPKCGAILPSAATAGLCPRCLMAEAMVPSDPGAEPAEAKKMFAPAELAPYFPQLEILECLGRGGMGVVYKARQKSLNRLVALKLLAPECVNDAGFAGRFQTEAQALAKLNHPDIVTVYDFGQAGGFYFLLMEFVDGMNLRQLLNAGRIAPREALAIVPQICDALQYAHDAGIVHRDIKPENILLDRQGRVKVADFGLAKLVGSSCTGVSPVAPAGPSSEKTGGTPVQLTTEAGRVMGTPQYMAPEQRDHPSDVDHRADIYSLGVVFYQMLTGELPGKQLEPPSSRMRGIVIDVRLDEVVLRALEKQPSRRYQQASDVKTIVETIATTPEGRGPSRPPPPAKYNWRTWSPFQSPEVREICTHLTDAERNELMRRGALSGIWLFVLPFLMLMAGIQSHNAVVLFATAGGLVLFYVGFVLISWMRNRQFFCATDWARKQGITPDKLRLFSFPWSAAKKPVGVATGSVASPAEPPVLSTGSGTPGHGLSVGKMLVIICGALLLVGFIAVAVLGSFFWFRYSVRGREEQVPWQRMEEAQAKAKAEYATRHPLANTNLSFGPVIERKPPTSAQELAERPQLRFLAWQDEWKTNQPGAARHLDGSSVTEAKELQWLRSVNSVVMDVSSLKLTPEPRFLHLWFSHPLFDRSSLNEVAFLDEAGKAIPLGANGSVSSQARGAKAFDNGFGWLTKTASPDFGNHLPAHVGVQLSYTLGPLERTQDLQVKQSAYTWMALENGIRLNGVGQNVDGKAFVAIAMDAKKMKSRKFGVIAVLKDGRELITGGGWSGNSDETGVRVEEFIFDVPLADVAKFIIGTRPIRTAEWKKVMLPMRSRVGRD